MQTWVVALAQGGASSADLSWSCFQPTWSCSEEGPGWGERPYLCRAWRWAGTLGWGPVLGGPPGSLSGHLCMREKPQAWGQPWPLLTCCVPAPRAWVPAPPPLLVPSSMSLVTLSPPPPSAPAPVPLHPSPH